MTRRPRDCTSCSYAAWQGDGGRCNAQTDDAPFPAWMRNVFNTSTLARAKPYRDCTAYEPAA